MNDPTPAPRFRAALIGCGRIGAGCLGVGQSRLQSHAAAYEACQRTELVAASDLDDEALACVRQRWNVERLYRDAREMLEVEEPEFVSVCTPAASHLALMREVVATGSVKGVVLEKPVAPTANESAEIVTLVEESGVTVAVNYGRRYASGYRTMAEALRRGRYGDVQHVQAVYTKGIVNNGSHVLDLLRLLFGEPSGFTVLSVADPAAEDPDVGFRVVYEGRFDAWVACADASRYNVFDMDVLGTRGRVRVTDLGHRLEHYTVKDTQEAYGFRQLAIEPDVRDTGLDGATEHAIQDVLDARMEGRSPLCTLRDAGLALSMALEIADAAGSGSEVFRPFASLQ